MAATLAAPRPAQRAAVPLWLPVAAAVVGVSVLIAAGVYLSSQSPIAPPGNLAITFATPYWSGNSVVVSLSSVSTPTGPAAFLVNLAINGSEGSPVSMPTTSGMGNGVYVYPAGYAFRIDWSDNDYDGQLSTYDSFTLSPAMAYIPCCITGTFSLLWRGNGALLAHADIGPFTPNTPPSVQLGTPVRGTSTNAWVPVLDVSPSAPGTYFEFQLVVGGVWSQVYGLGLPNGPAVNVSFNGSEYIVAWYDLNGDQRLDAGDGFNITMVSGTWPAAGTTMAFVLEWYDGSTLAVATWTA